MGRKNNRLQVETLPLSLQTLMSDESRTWRVTLSNGSGFTTIDLDGTSETCWELAARMGARGGVRPGKWEPKRIDPVGPVLDGPFNVI